VKTVAELCQDREDFIYVTDVGQHQMIAAQETKHKKPGTFITSGGLGTMGFGLPAAIGAAFGKTADRVILFSGDGSIQMTIQELATVKKAPVPVYIFVLDNNRLGMVRQWQKHFYGGRYSQSVLKDNPEFAAIAAAYGIKGAKISSRENLGGNIKKILDSGENTLVHFITDPEENVYPIIPTGKNNYEMLVTGEADSR
jgi:acetolactate synthase-1/2/3 large subunit